MLSLNQVKTEAKIIWQGVPHEVLEANHLKMGRAGAKLVTKLKNLISGSIIEYTFSGDEKLEPAEVRYKASQYLYSEGDKAYFMTNDDFETIEVNLDKDKSKYLLEGSSSDITIWDNKPIGIKIPKKVSLKVTYTEPGFKGNSQSATLKNATLETDLEVQVPLFINIGDTVVINTDTGKYDSRQQ